MKELKFKAWCAPKIGRQFRSSYKPFMTDEFTFKDFDEDYFVPEGIYIEDMEIIQFTGKYDADINGRKIFDTDIIENCDTKELQVVYWNEGKAAWYCRYIKDSDIIVSLADSLGSLNKKIGNSYENPELLK